MNANLLTITTCRAEGKRNRWVARLTKRHPVHTHMGVGDSVSYGDTEADVLTELATLGYSRDASGVWSYELPERLRGPGVPFTDADGVARLGAV